MSTTTAPVTSLRTTRKEQPAKAPAKKAPAKTAEKKAEPKEAKTYVATATGRGGKTNVRKVPAEVHFAVDVADLDGKTPAAKAGLIYRFFSTEETATAFAAKKNADGLDAIVVTASSEEVK